MSQPLHVEWQCATSTGPGGAARRQAVGAEALAALLDAVPQALLLVAHPAIVRHANRAAEELLRDASALQIRDGELVAAGSSTSRLKRAIDVARAGTGQRAIVLSLDADASRRPLTLLLWPLPAAAHATEPLVALFAADVSRSDTLDLSLLRRLYGLTAAEARVAALVAAGQSLAEIAARLHVRRSTTRTHLQRALAKTRVSRQAALVRLLLDGPAQLRLR